MDHAAAVVRAAVAVSVLVVGWLIYLGTRPDWYAITSATASSRSATRLSLMSDGCPGEEPQPHVEETDREVRIRVDIKHEGDEKACLSGWTVELSRPIGDRAVIDVRHHSEVAVTIALPFTMPTPTWLPAGWKRGGEHGGTAEFLDADGRSAVTMQITDDPAILEQFRGRPTDPVEVQGHPAVWVSVDDALVVQGGGWTMIMKANAGADRSVVERIAASLDTIPFAADEPPLIPAMFNGTVGELAQVEGRATVHAFAVHTADGWMLCDQLDAADAGCAGPTMEADFSNAVAPRGVEHHGEVDVTPDQIAVSGVIKDGVLFAGV